MSRNIYIALFCLAATSCNSGRGDDGTRETVIEDHAQIVTLRERVDGLEGKMSGLQSESAAAEQRLSALEGAHQILARTFDRNARAANEDAAKEMTRRGACGEESYVDNYGYTRLRNKECTVKDLRVGP